MRNFIRTGLIVALVALAPTALRAQATAEVRVAARMVMPQFLILNVVSDAATVDGAGRVELKVTANLNWTVSVTATDAGVEYQVVSAAGGKTAQGGPGNNHKVVVEYRHSGGTTASDATKAPLEYVIAAR